MTSILTPLSILCVWVCLLSGCQPQDPTQIHNGKRLSTAQAAHHGLWDRIRDNYQTKDKTLVPHAKKQQKIHKHVNYYKNNEKKLAYLSKQATPYLHYVVEELEKRQMPSELALLPAIESAYQPQATSQKGAAGLWQFIPSTGRNQGLKQNAWYDGRRDIKASTQAALNYLAFLHNEFQDWHLALAAYNAGEHAVHRAIKRNRAQGKPTTFWDLPLPKETQEYVPRLLALAKVIANPEKHAIRLPVIENKPYFTSITFDKVRDLHNAANLVGATVKELKLLNPGHRNSIIHPKSSQEILIPISYLPTLPEQLLNPL